ncbi:hypothetical protein BCR44DRAFT_1329570 [Catenaria anguillulae PL171]|uniref:Uncharacterized protein n=1 Tax=Catenaria anguillulae PL171 TaxID=765915 RepID=A0A1Y2H6Q5_9FUNG|nr:hypothetical protein BCR44DRAFT_1329570 [Catenaria anguillulae PL171]
MAERTRRLPITSISNNSSMLRLSRPRLNNSSTTNSTSNTFPSTRLLRLQPRQRPLPVPLRDRNTWLPDRVQRVARSLLKANRRPSHNISSMQVMRVATFSNSNSTSYSRTNSSNTRSTKRTTRRRVDPWLLHRTITALPTTPPLLLRLP